MKNIKIKLKKSKNNKYVNMVVEVEDMTFEVVPTFLNNKQKARLNFLLSEVVKNAK